jgi:TolA-binding protein
MSNIDDQVKVLSDQLNLTPDQQSKIKSILTDQHDQAMAIIQDNNTAREAKMDKIHSLRTSTIGKVRQLLKGDQQTKFDQMVQQQDERIRQKPDQSGSTGSSGGSPSGASPSSTTPSSTSPGTPPTGAKPPQ